MTVGDKQFVLMASQLGTANGPAQLNGSSVLPVTQGGTEQGNTQAALSNLGAGVRPNLLDNPYFVGGGTGWGVFPVNQNKTTSITVQQEANTFVDRWVTDWGISIEISSVGIEVISGSGFSQRLSDNVISVINNQTVTASVLNSDFQLFTVTGVANGANIGTSGLGASLLANYSGRPYSFHLSRDTWTYAKLELGENQTLAYQGDDGLWHLLPQPDLDYRTQLLKCQAYYQLYSSAELRPAKAVDCRPVMRIDPTPGTIQIGETTYYYNSAEL